MDAPRSCILLYGNAEARPFNLATAPVLNFTEGSVVGNLGASPRMRVHHESKSSGSSHASSSTTAATAAVGVADSKWRRIKRENTLRNDIHLYNKVIISGPADYIVVTESDVRETGSGAADRLQWAKMFGLERFVGCLRQAVFEPGAIIVREGHQLSHLYLIVEGECRASVERDDTNRPSTVQFTDASSTSSKLPLTTAEAQLRHARKFRWSDDFQLPVASLGQKSAVGDISLVLGIPEPTTVRAVTTVHALSLSQEDFLRESSDRHDPVVLACIEKLQSTAYDTLRFVLERVEIEAKNEHCDQRLKIDLLRDILRHKQPVIQGDKQLSDLSSVSSANGRGASAERTSSSYDSGRAQSPAGTSTAGVPSRVMSLPSVVLRHVAANAEDKKLRARNQIGNFAAISGEDVVEPVESPTRMTRQQRKAARAFANLQHPVAGKSLGDYVQMPVKTTIVDTLAADQPTKPASDDLLFLFPTVTKRRQLHGKYRGYDAVPAE
ncbi:hypothetical protein PHYSODRAFT_297075 [Phytophthora sojae]|uniref:Cyclic nucleotide-binding domain-containing protein n=1 Tax=Phytophthora sojae (strain P6497) TaxID=1094619 RepID=G4YSZ2_PHYSP|nr:hypothetical protein PHYSODRAFT_297075 [Phytophthora sojae]EGZ25411.1 hypothetical protein PHYSODRAFT_297075 [Phytophthora sojae]|eukprot:XP_009520699.1 hypothetical protein PHYSODRAFT_297075 [Phytophthora sojae]